MVVEHIEKSWKAYKKNFWPIITAMLLQLILSGIPVLIGFIPWIFIFLFSKGANITTLILSNLGVLSFTIIMCIIGVLISIALTAGFVRMLYEALRGKTKFETMLKTARKKFWTIIGANLIFLLVILCLIIVIFFPLLSLIGSPSLLGGYSFSSLIIIFSIAILGLILIGLISIFFVFIDQAIVIDDLKAIPSISKSFEVAKKSYLTILGLMFIFILINSALDSLFSIIGVIIESFVTTPLLLLSYISVYLEKKSKK